MASYEEWKAAQAEAEKKRDEVPTERWRTGAQGLSFGFSDELEAMARSVFEDRPYEDIVNEIRGNISKYKEARPVESTLLEIGGALPTALVGAPARLATTALRGMGEGALYAAGTEDGTIGERAAAAIPGAIGGGVGGVVGTGLGAAIGGAANAAVQFARSSLGQKGATVVDRELQRLADSTGFTRDELIQKIADGEILAENKTLESVARSMYQKGGEGKTALQRGLQGRPEAMRGEAMQSLQPQMTDIQGKGVRPEMERRLASEKKTAGQGYAPFKTTPLGDELKAELQDALERVPGAANELNRVLQAESKQNPFFKIDEETNQFVFTREPTAYDAEVVRRAIKNVAGKEYREGYGAAGEAVGDVEKSLRSAIDNAVPELADTRALYKIARQNEEAFKAGTKAFQGDTQMVLDNIGNMTDEQLKAFRAGAMSTIIQRMGTARAGSTVTDIATDERNMNAVIRALLPADKADDIIAKFAQANRSKEAAGKIMQGSDTAASLMEQGQLGNRAGAIEAGLSAMGGDLGPLFGMTRRAIASSIPQGSLSPQQEAELAQYLVTTNPRFIERALKDEGMGKDLQAYIQKLAGIIAKGGRLAGVQETAPLTVDVTKGLLGVEQ